MKLIWYKCIYATHRQVCEWFKLALGRREGNKLPKNLKDMVKNAHILQYYDRANLYLLVLTLAQKGLEQYLSKSRDKLLTHLEHQRQQGTGTSFSRQMVGSCWGTENAFVQPTTVLGKHREHAQLCESWRFAWKHSATGNSNENDANDNAEPTNVPVPLQPSSTRSGRIVRPPAKLTKLNDLLICLCPFRTAREKNCNQRGRKVSQKHILFILFYHGNLLTVPIDKIDGHVLWNHFRIMMGRSLLLQRPSFFLWFPRARVSSSCVGFLRGNLFGCILSFGIYEACIRDALRRKKVKEVSIMRMHAMAWGRVLNWRWHTAHPYFGTVDKCLHFQQTLVYEIFETL